MTAKKTAARKTAAKKTAAPKAPTPDHPDQAVDTDLPDDTINEDAFRALQENYEGDPDEVDGHTDDEEA